MKANIDKCHFLSNLDIASTMTIETFAIQNLASQEILGITIGRHLIKMYLTYAKQPAWK